VIRLRSLEEVLMAAKDTHEDAKSDDQDAGHSLDMSQAAVM
jgi:RNA polymerase primary sigma factor